MKRSVPIIAASILAVATPSTVEAIDTATAPTLVKSTIITYTLYRDVMSTVAVDGPAVIQLTNIAYRHPEEVQAIVIAPEAGTFEIRDLCKPYLLPHTWIVYVDGVRVAATSGLKCQ